MSAAHRWRSSAKSCTGWSSALDRQSIHDRERAAQADRRCAVDPVGGLARVAEEVRGVDAAGAEAKLLGGAVTLSSYEDGFAAVVDELIRPRARNGTGSM
jgi:hypothetical protein